MIDPLPLLGITRDHGFLFVCLFNICLTIFYHLLFLFDNQIFQIYLMGTPTSWFMMFFLTCVHQFLSTKSSLVLVLP